MLDPVWLWALSAKMIEEAVTFSLMPWIIIGVEFQRQGELWDVCRRRLDEHEAALRREGIL